MVRAVELFAAVHCVVIGLSHCLQPMVWVDFFSHLRDKGRAGVFVNGFLSLWFGSIVVAFHNVWEGWPVVLTLLGWAQVVKALVCFVLPQWGLRSLGRVRAERAHEFRYAGVVLLAFGGLFGFLAFR
jgi:hypothetical protein